MILCLMSFKMTEISAIPFCGLIPLCSLKVAQNYKRNFKKLSRTRLVLRKSSNFYVGIKSPIPKSISQIVNFFPSCQSVTNVQHLVSTQKKIKTPQKKSFAQRRKLEILA